jgi:hypothetical protein
MPLLINRVPTYRLDGADGVAIMGRRDRKRAKHPALVNRQKPGSC